jgi:beta-glucosidase
MFNRRNFIASSMAMMSAPTWAATVKALPKNAFPKGFHWGAATAGHQIEGNNVNSDFWVLENTKPTLFAEPSGDACNSLALWQADLDLAKSMGLNCYRFSIEWSRIEPAPGQFSIAMLDHYKRVVEGCRKRGLLRARDAPFRRPDRCRIHPQRTEWPLDCQRDGTAPSD